MRNYFASGNNASTDSPVPSITATAALKPCLGGLHAATAVYLPTATAASGLSIAARNGEHICIAEATHCLSMDEDRKGIADLVH